MIQYDSKLFYGIKLGKLPDIVKCFEQIIPTPPHKPIDDIDVLGWINTQIPDGLYLEASYPVRECEPRDIMAHLNLLDYDDTISNKHMKKFLKRANYIDYANILGRLGLDYKEPVFYTQHYVYSENK